MKPIDLGASEYELLTEALINLKNILRDCKNISGIVEVESLISFDYNIRTLILGTQHANFLILKFNRNNRLTSISKATNTK